MTMTPHPTQLLRLSAAALLVVSGVSWWVAGSAFAMDVLIAGLAVVLNFGLLGWLSTGVMRETTSESGVFTLLLGTKLLYTLPAFAALMWFTSPIAVGVAFLAPFIAVAAYGFAGTRATAELGS